MLSDPVTDGGQARGFFLAAPGLPPSRDSSFGSDLQASATNKQFGACNHSPAHQSKGVPTAWVSKSLAISIRQRSSNPRSASHPTRQNHPRPRPFSDPTRRSRWPLKHVNLSFKVAPFGTVDGSELDNIWRGIEVWARLVIDSSTHPHSLSRLPRRPLRIRSALVELLMICGWCQRALS